MIGTDELDFEIKFDDGPQGNTDVRDTDPEAGVHEIKYGSTDAQTDILAVTIDEEDTQPALQSEPGLDSDQKLSAEKTDPETEKSSAKKPKQTMASALGVFSINYWQNYFDVNQFEIKDRLLGSLNPVSPAFATALGEKPDLYGPFWITSFLIFLLTITGNFTEVISSHALGYSTSDLYNFENIGVAVSVCYGALITFPPLFVAVNKGMGSELQMMYAICVYGYSNTIFVVGSIVCIIPVNLIRWIVLTLCCAHSVCFIITNFKSALSKHQGDYKLALMGLIAMSQMFLAFCFKLKFY